MAAYGSVALQIATLLIAADLTRDRVKLMLLAAGPGVAGPTPAPGAETVPAAKPVRSFRVRGSVPMENYGELFRCFVGPAARTLP